MIFIITAVHNRIEITKKFIQNVQNQKYKDKHLILIDDGSTDGTSDMVKRIIPNSTIIKGNGDLWWGGSLNEAYKWISTNKVDDNDYVMFANDDTEFEDNYIEIAIKLLEKNPNTLIAGCGYSIKSGKLIDSAFIHDFKTGVKIGGIGPNNEGNCASTRSLFFRVCDFKKVGGFRPVLLPHYASDYEWTIRAAKQGLKIKSFEELKYFFDEGTTGDNDYNKLSIRKIFSKRSNCNPIYKLNFIVISTPLKYIPEHLICQFKRYLFKIPVLFKIIKDKYKLLK